MYELDQNENELTKLRTNYTNQFIYHRKNKSLKVMQNY